MVDQLVKRVEDFCDVMEKIPHFMLFGERLSKPASIAAMRAFYYVEKNNPDKHLSYECLRFILTDPACQWVNLSLDEQIALIKKLEIHTVLVFY